MKNSPAVFLISLAVSAISLTVPLPTATTVLNLFIGEEIAVQDTPTRHTECTERAVPAGDSMDDIQASSPEDLQETVTLQRVFSMISDFPLCFGREGFIQNAVGLHVPGSTFQEL